MTRVYLSSTRTDLASECRTIASWLESIGLIAVDSYGPAGLPVLESCLADIDTCGIYLLVLGHYYVSMVTAADGFCRRDDQAA